MMNKAPQTINGLMQHLRNECNVAISGSEQKQQLIRALDFYQIFYTR